MPPLPSPSAGVNSTEPDTTGGGAMKTSTKVGIFIGVACFCILLLSFHFVARWKRKPKPITIEDRFRQESFERWQKNVLGTESKGSPIPRCESPVSRSSTMSHTTLAQHEASEGKGFDPKSWEIALVPPVATR
ncbi:hypothetical protein BD410DRAFT_791899 [Rickenella mellea]|uniref:Uncharacterized protein n=1 Tax=Rickenella mellea TaxID=50990 RepID=A0A4Y7PXE2_9AGAM|nr:hypothetical protein BD410DRAFT_791899 [Rickenella mellea]